MSDWSLKVINELMVADEAHGGEEKIIIVRTIWKRKHETRDMQLVRNVKLTE